jgi:hypothetical protein
MTAILYCGTSEGFVIGADGRAIGAKEKVVTNTERKIFLFKNLATSVVFAWSGTIKVGSSNLYLSLVDETHDLLLQLDFNSCFAQELNTKLKDRLPTFRTNLTGSASGIFLSYRKSEPWISELSVFKNGRTWDCCIDENVANGEIVIACGPNRSFEKPRSLSEAVSAIQVYLEDCVADPTEEGIGGHIHIAKFTPDGFSWIQPPKPA